MVDLFFISDTHFHHTNSWKVFKRADGSPLRPFQSDEEMDELMVQRWNETVSPSAHIYHLGDVTMHRSSTQAKAFVAFMKRLHGHKRLVLGNHDQFPIKVYLAAGFEKVYATHVIDRVVLSHVPIHPSSVTRFRGNIHGHIHDGEPLKPVLWLKNDDPGRVQVTPYVNITVEHTDYRPLTWKAVLARLAAAGETSLVPQTSPPVQQEPVPSHE